MATRTAARAIGKTGRDLTAELAFLTRALKAPTLREAIPRLSERARTESWTHEEFLVACLQREVSARESHGGEGRIRAARFPARKSLEEFDFDHARGLKREVIAHHVEGRIGVARVLREPRSRRRDRAQQARALEPHGVEVILVGQANYQQDQQAFLEDARAQIESITQEE